MTVTDRVHEDREVCAYLAEMDYLSNCDAITEALGWDSIFTVEEAVSSNPNALAAYEVIHVPSRTRMGAYTSRAYAEKMSDYWRTHPRAFAKAVSQL